MFDSINNILFDKKKDISLDNLANFSPYMVARYFSFYSNDWVDYCNETVNKYSNVFETEKEQYDFHMNVVPKLRKKRITYVKRPKQEKKEDITNVPDFYSKKELEMLTKMLD